MPKYTVAQFKAAIPKSGGIISVVAKRLGCEWHTVRDKIAKHETLQEMMRIESELVSDAARSNIVHDIVENKDITTSKWYLTMKDPEFMPKQQVEHTGGIIINYSGNVNPDEL